MPSKLNDERHIKRAKTRFLASSATLVNAHPLGIRPSGNALLSSNSIPRTQSFGPLIGSLQDELIMTIIQELEDPKDLLALGHSCKALYGFCWTDELWKHMVHKYDRAPEKWCGSWRKTFWKVSDDKTPGKEEVLISCKGILFSDLLYRPFQCTQVDYERIVKRVLEEEPVKGVIPVMPEREMTLEKFTNEGWNGKPFMLNLEDERPAAKWTVNDLVDRFGDVVFRQEYMDWKLKVYNEYMHQNEDEKPLYLFDCGSEAMQTTLRKEYRVPAADVIGDDHDFFTLLGTVRPDHRWLILGPKRSGSSFHKDPNATCAWNAVLAGHKYWVMFPPDIPPPGIATDGEESEVTAPCSIAEWFLGGFYDQARLQLQESSQEGQGQSGSFMHGVCGPNQMMYVPSGWWHLVVNLDECLALTGNFVPAASLSMVLDFLKNKPDQISGFKWAKLRALLDKTKSITHDEIKSNDDDNDCLCDDDIQDDAAKQVFDLFINRIKESESELFSEKLEGALEKLGRVEEQRQKARDREEELMNGDGKSKQWHTLVDTEEASSFSFGFSLE